MSAELDGHVTRLRLRDTDGTTRAAFLDEQGCPLLSWVVDDLEGTHRWIDELAEGHGKAQLDVGSRTLVSSCAGVPVVAVYEPSVGGEPSLSLLLSLDLPLQVDDSTAESPAAR